MAARRKQEKNTGDRAALIAAFNNASREASGLGAIFAKAAAEHMGISQSDFECIDIVALRGRVTAGELAAATGLTTGAVTGVIDRLEAAGIARRQRDSEDRRRVYVTILPKAMAAGAAFYASFEKAVHELVARYTDAEIVLLTDYFHRSRQMILGEITRLRTQAPPKRPRSLRPAGDAAPTRSRRRLRP
jgi:DNA-binding MarR family transcriptional regulator